MADENQLVELTNEFKKATDEVKKLGEDITGKMAAGEKITGDLKEQADHALTTMNGFKARVDELEQKLARHGEDDEGQEQKSFGEQFVESQNFKGLAESGSQRGRADMQFKATITLATANAAGSAGATVQNSRLPGIVAQPDRRLTVRDLITPGRMDGNALEYARETGFTNAAAAVAETAKKPQSDIQFDLVSTTAKVIAHYVKASRQILSDAPMLASYIDGRLRYGLAYKEEQQLLNGDGTGQNLLGIVPQATAFAAPFALTGATTMDTLRLAMLQAVLAEFPATGHVLNPIDWARIELTKDSEGRYIIGQPQGVASPTMWGLPVVSTQAMASGKFLTGAFRMGAQLFDRWMARVEVATENEDDFVKNLVTILAEERLALAVYRPEAFIYGNVVPAV
ncbi:phage major capsid protein [Pseudomonas sp. CDFA 602]|uniref:phage major capsid protein n=1 Tax=Pseudomonas californiensis TaxID=2829823 RepID=UPI001E59F154|nr:phage major capsid protein [Pseudomonas californiensis]MCD5996500.1 phage major capsid protein [Pseudomonas californiensis]MCD6002099.1 phage major capsid protein [Pseudomonas californiensis]